jgi:hypothetical protein
VSITAFSYSRLKSFESCAKKYAEISVFKRVQDLGNEHTQFGTEVHEAFAAYFKSGTPLPIHLQQYQKYLAAIKKALGKFIVEQKLAINDKYQATGWFDKDVFCRIISDLTIINRANAVMWDWKTGRPGNDFDQLDLAGAVMFLLVPELQKIKLAYFWTKTKEITSKILLRTDMPEVWSRFLPRVQVYHDAHVNVQFPPTPGPLCRYCPVKDCNFHP